MRQFDPLPCRARRGRLHGAVAAHLGPMSGSDCAARRGAGRPVRGCDGRSVLGELVRDCEYVAHGLKALATRTAWMARSVICGRCSLAGCRVCGGCVRTCRAQDRRHAGSTMLGGQCGGRRGGPGTGNRQGCCPTHRCPSPSGHGAVAQGPQRARGCRGFGAADFGTTGDSWGAEVSAQGSVRPLPSAPPAPIPVGRPAVVHDLRLAAGPVGPAHAPVGRPRKWLARCIRCRRKAPRFRFLACAVAQAVRNSSPLRRWPHTLVSMAGGHKYARCGLFGSSSRRAAMGLLFARPYDHSGRYARRASGCHGAPGLGTL